MTRNFAPLSGLTALAALTFSAALPARAQTITVTDLTLPGHSAVAQGIDGNAQVGYGRSRALLWHGTADSVINLNPAGFSGSSALGVSGNTQVGFGYKSSSGPLHAMLWHGTPTSFVDLHPAGFAESMAAAVSGDKQVGYAYSIDPATGHAYNYHSFLWTGTADSVLDLTPAGTSGAEALGIDGNAQVGYGTFGVETNGDLISHALLWHGTADSVVDLNGGFLFSEARSVSGDTQVGYGSGGGPVHALLWHGTANSVVDLNPFNFINSAAFANAGDVQVGSGNDISQRSHALLWRGTAGSAIDLNAYLPAGYTSEAVAYGVSGSGTVYDVVGYGGGHAFLWHIVFASAAKPVVQHLYPASRTEGGAGFTLTVTGRGFENDSVILWNYPGGVSAFVTTFVSSTKLTAQIPASQIAQAGTAKITVTTPSVNGYQVSNAHVLTIMARPVITGLSPASKKVGSGAFTLTVTGAEARPHSFYAPTVVKWNGVELTTTYVSASKLTAQVPASLLAHSGTAKITVTTPQVATSAGIAFTVSP